ncbi:MAG: hypothetical protein QUT30_10125 [Acidobacteriota bacterium]|jgi:hypothetical protein|nr:hypothetical protein [Acidobacteriota bacterium]
MNTGNSNSSPHPGPQRGLRKYLLAGVCVLSGIVLLFLLFLFKTNESHTKSVSAKAKDYMAELVAATGTVLVRTSGQNEWNPATVGAHLFEGDLVQTDHSGEASVRYRNGATVTIQARTIFTVRNSGDGSMEISVPGIGTDEMEPLSDANGDSVASGQSGPESGNTDAAKGSRPFIRLDRIISFGRSLELIGTVETGSRLSVNGESVEVAGDGSFKHFTKPFPASAGRVRLQLKASNLAGRTRIVTTTYDFNPPGGDN